MSKTQYCKSCKKYFQSSWEFHLDKYHGGITKEELSNIYMKESGRIEKQELTIYNHINIKGKALREALYKVHDGKCFYTGKKITFENMHIDHIVPKDKGGKDCLANFVPTSSFTNRSKRNKELDNIEEFIILNETNYAPKVLKLLLKNKTFIKGRNAITGPARHNSDKLISKYTRILDEPQNNIQAEFLKKLHSIKAKNGKPGSIVKLEWLEELYKAWKEKQT